MEAKIKILVVEDEMIIAAKISLQLTSMGYEVTAILPRGEEAILQMAENRPDIILLDINLKGKYDGIETAGLIRQSDQIPIIYLTANADEASFNRAKTTRPAAFISKPFKQLDLQRAIELAISRIDDAGHLSEKPSHDAPAIMLADRIFVRHSNRMIKIMMADILYIEADRNYSRIFTRQKEYMLATTLKHIEEKLPGDLFLRIHRSYIVHLAQVDEVAESHVMIGQKSIPLSSEIRDRLLRTLRTL